MFEGCSCNNCDAHRGHNGDEVYQIQLSTDLADESGKNPLRYLLPHEGGDIFDMPSAPLPVLGPSSAAQRDLRDQLELPLLDPCPTPPDCEPDDSMEERRGKLLAMFQEFALDLHIGTYLTQLVSTSEYFSTHCQLVEDMTILKLDTGNGRIIEFPLASVSRVYRAVRYGGKWYVARTIIPPADASNMEEVVIVEFKKRKLAFVFPYLDQSRRFRICMNLLVQRAQEKEAMQEPGSRREAGPSRPCKSPCLGGLPEIQRAPEVTTTKIRQEPQETKVPKEPKETKGPPKRVLGGA